MKKIVSALVFAFSLITVGLAQQPRPIPTPPLVDNTDVVKISTTLIRVDVSVTDEDGKIVTDLKPEDFEIYENGVKQDITSFSFVSSGSEENIGKKDERRDKLVLPVPPQNIKPEQVRRTMALIVDDLSLSFESMHFVRRSLKNFVENKCRTVIWWR